MGAAAFRVFLLAAAVLWLAACKPEDSPVAVARPPVVRTVIVAPALSGGARYTGVVHARYESALGFRVSGKILERLVDPGDRVHKAQPLMRLDVTDFTLALKAAHASVEAARAAAIRATNDEMRRRALVKQGWVSTQTYEQDKATADSSEAQLAAAEAQEKQIADQANYAVLEADADGVVMDVPSDPGQVVAAGQTVVRLAHEGPREAEVYLPEGEERNASAPAVAALYARPDESFPAKLRELSAMADPATRTYRARYVLAADGKDAPLGATVTLRLSERPEVKPVFDVPIGALFDDGRGPCVWVVTADGSTVTSRPVSVTHIGEERAAVTSGLQSGERIVAIGAHLLKAGEKVAIANGPLDVAAR